MDINIEKNYDTFMYLLKKYVKRDGIDKLIGWLENTDIKYAPASSRYGMSCDGGLIQHSLNVFYRLVDTCNQMYPNNDCPYSEESMVIVSLLHEISKVNLYDKVVKNVTDENGNWQKSFQYVVKPIEKRFVFATNEENTLYKISKFIDLTYDEEIAIRWCKAAQDAQMFCRMYEALSVSRLALIMHVSELIEECTDYGYFNYVVDEEKTEESAEEFKDSHVEEKTAVEDNKVLLSSESEYGSFMSKIGDFDGNTREKIGDFETSVPF